MKNEKQCAVLDWMIADLSGRDTRTMKQAAAAIGITPSYLSKIVAKIAGFVITFP
jgi:DNA-binding IscR family transcriptional regulator